MVLHRQGVHPVGYYGLTNPTLRLIQNQHYWECAPTLSAVYAIGSGMTIFKDLSEIQKFNLVKSVAFDCGIIGVHYEPKRVL
jgi:hypothetical protein